MTKICKYILKGGADVQGKRFRIDIVLECCRHRIDIYTPSTVYLTYTYSTDSVNGSFLRSGFESCCYFQILDLRSDQT